jgi:FkbM family methyltransferase
MRLTETSIKGLTNFYWLARKSRFLDTVLGKTVFSASYFLYKRYLEDPYHDLVERRPKLFRGGNILDVGANIGYTATVFSRVVGPEYRVYAFEPERFNYNLLERSARTRKTLQRIVPIQSAVGDLDGTIELWENEHHHGDHRILTDQFRHMAASPGAVSVPITTLDAFVSKQPGEFPVRFIKVDVQGYELPVCQGMERTLDNNPHGIVALEYMPGAMCELGFQPEDLLIWFQQRDFKVYTIEKQGRLSPGVMDFSGGHGYCDLLFSRENLSEPG